MTTNLRLAAGLFLIVVMSFGCAGMGARVPRPAADFEVEVLNGDMAGQTVSLKDFKGAPLVLNIGAIWCPHCLHEIPSFAKAYEKYKDDTAFLVVFIKSERGAIDDMLNDEKPPFTVGEDPGSAIGKAYGVKAIPVTLFIDPDGMITDEYVGGLSESKLSDKVEKLIGPGGAE